MAKPGPKHSISAAQEALAHRLDFEGFLSKLAPKDKLNAERRVALLEEADPARARLWQRLACTLMTLAPQAAKLVGKQAVQFYIPDGKYRMQVFALEDLQDGNFTVYCPDVLEEATAAGLLAQPDESNPHLRLIGTSTEPLLIESLSGASLSPAAHYKDLVGWNRKALRITLPPSASPLQVETTELLCAMAAHYFVAAKPAEDKGAAK
jgi:hypothetical protein